jgi:predicted dehydrogenase
MTASFIFFRRYNLEEAKLLRWGIVSTGQIAEKFCEDMEFVKNGKLAAVAARKLDDAQAFAKKYHIETAYEGYQQLFDDPHIDVIYIATPHNFHYEQAKAALEAGKSVLCEKPITISSIECEALQTLAQQKNLFLMEAIWTYFLPAIKQAKQWVSDGKIGTLKHIKADFGYVVPYDPVGRMYNPELAGGCLFDMGIYPLAIAQYFNPAQLTDITLKVQKAKSGVDNDLVILAKANDVTLSLATSFQCRLQNAALIIGDEGYIYIPNFWRAKSCELYKTDTLLNSFEDTSLAIGYCHEAEAVAKAIFNGQTEHKIASHKVSLSLQKQMEIIKALF